MARQDSVREGDGPALIQFWKQDLVSFWQGNHHKYFILGHKMLTGWYNHSGNNLITAGCNLHLQWFMSFRFVKPWFMLTIRN